MASTSETAKTDGINKAETFSLNDHDWILRSVLLYTITNKIKHIKQTIHVFSNIKKQNFSFSLFVYNYIFSSNVVRRSIECHVYQCYSHHLYYCNYHHSGRRSSPITDWSTSYHRSISVNVQENCWSFSCVFTAGYNSLIITVLTADDSLTFMFFCFFFWTRSRSMTLGFFNFLFLVNTGTIGSSKITAGQYTVIPV